MAKDDPREASRPRRLSLQVPKNTNLEKMSDDEVEKLALDMSRKMAASLPKGSELSGIEGVTLTQQGSAAGFGIGIGWSRACDRAELSREGLVVNPQVFVDPIRTEDIVGKSARVTIKQAAATTKAEKRSKKK